MNDTTINDLVLFEGDGKFMWVREGASTPQGWNPVTKNEWTVEQMPIDMRKYEIEVDFK